MSDKEFEELTEKIQELDRARRELAQALDASRLGSQEGDRWPRALPQQRRIDRRPFLLGVAAVMLAAAFMTWEWTAAPEASPKKTSSVATASVATASVTKPVVEPVVPPAPEQVAAAAPVSTPPCRIGGKRWTVSTYSAPTLSAISLRKRSVVSIMYSESFEP